MEVELKRSREETERVRRSRSKSEPKGDLDAAQRALIALRREYSDLKVTSVRELGKMRVEVANMARMASTACMEISSTSNFIKDSRGREIDIGSVSQIYEKYERMKKEKDDLEDKLETAEKSVHLATKKITLLERHNSTQENVSAARKELFSEDPIRAVRLGKLEGENVLLRSSLQDIASMVDLGAERSVHTGPGSKPRPVTPQTSRRTRSASPAMIESTVAAVQSVLNQRQVEKHDLQGRLDSLRDKFELVKKSEGRWETRTKLLDSELTTTKEELNTIRKEFNETKEDLEETIRKLAQTRKEKEKLFQKWKTLKDETDSSLSTFKDIQRQNVKLEKKTENLSSENSRLEERMSDLVNDAKESGILISQLERVGSSLREEAGELRERLAAVERDQERLERERTEKETIITEEKLNSTTISSQITKMERQEKILVEKVLLHEETETMLKTEISLSQGTISGLREEILVYETRLLRLEKELEEMKQMNVEHGTVQEILEGELRTVKGEKTRLENQLTSLNLRKDAMEDRNTNLQEEIRQLKVYKLCNIIFIHQHYHNYYCRFFFIVIPIAITIVIDNYYYYLYLLYLN